MQRHCMDKIRHYHEYVKCGNYDMDKEGHYVQIKRLNG